MSSYSDNESSCRVSMWKASGKWYTDVAVSFVGYHEEDIHAAFAKSLRGSLDHGQFSGMWATCLDPYHMYSHPISINMDSVWGIEDKNDEVWIDKKGNRTPVSKLKVGHLRNIVRSIVRRRRERREALNDMDPWNLRDDPGFLP